MRSREKERGKETGGRGILDSDTAMRECEREGERDTLSASWAHSPQCNALSESNTEKHTPATRSRASRHGDCARPADTDKHPVGTKVTDR